MDGFIELLDAIGALARRRYQTAERFFSELGLNHTEARLLTLLQQKGGAAAQDALSEMLYVDRTNAGRALRRLEQDGYISKRRGEDDKRANLVRITAKGRDAAAAVSRLKKRIARSLFSGINEDEARAATLVLTKAAAEEKNNRS
ncbi:MAG: MarR family transcriptional regulator [Alphaproteobacteria bacterium]|nr:MarR family transcriptional regulator [Alphaproteobacteria bacterium]